MGLSRVSLPRSAAPGCRAPGRQCGFADVWECRHPCRGGGARGHRAMLSSRRSRRQSFVATARYFNPHQGRNVRHFRCALLLGAAWAVSHAHETLSAATCRRAMPRRSGLRIDSSSAWCAVATYEMCCAITAAWQQPSIIGCSPQTHLFTDLGAVSTLPPAAVWHPPRRAAVRNRLCSPGGSRP
jgi:hypothetical protein